MQYLNTTIYDTPPMLFYTSDSQALFDGRAAKIDASDSFLRDDTARAQSHSLQARVGETAVCNENLYFPLSNSSPTCLTSALLIYDCMNIDSVHCTV